MPRYLCPNPDRTENIFIGPTRIYSARIGPDRNNLSLTRNPEINQFQTTACIINRHLNTPWNEAVVSYNMLTGIIVILLCQFGNLRGMVLVYPQNHRKEMSHTLVKNTPNRTDPKLNSPTQPDPKIFLKMFLDPGPVSVRSGPGKLGVSGWPAGLQLWLTVYSTSQYCLPGSSGYSW